MAHRRQRRERGSISVDEIVKGAFEVAAQVSDNILEFAERELVVDKSAKFRT